MTNNKNSTADRVTITDNTTSTTDNLTFTSTYNGYYYTTWPNSTATWPPSSIEDNGVTFTYPPLSSKEQISLYMRDAVQNGLSKEDLLEMYDMALAEAVIDE